MDKKCLECGGELVRTYGSSENGPLRPDIVNPVRRITPSGDAAPVDMPSRQRSSA